MATIAEILNQKLINKHIGIEIEVEGIGLPNNDNNLLAGTNWKCERDDSLRGECAEYVLRTPINLKDVEKNLDDLNKAFKKNSTIINDTYRAGVHVHINVRHLTPRQVMTFTCAYYVLENILIDWCHPSRVGNHFCLRTSDAEYVVQLVERALQENNMRLLDTDQIRYASLNLKSIFRHGTLEFRALESTTNWNKIYKWCEMLYNIREASLSYSSPREFVKSLKGNHDEFLHTFLGNNQNILRSDYKESMKKGIIIANDIAFAKNWDAVNRNIFRKDQGLF